MTKSTPVTPLVEAVERRKFWLSNITSQLRLEKQEKQNCVISPPARKHAKKFKTKQIKTTKVSDYHLVEFLKIKVNKVVPKLRKCLLLQIYDRGTIHQAS